MSSSFRFLRFWGRPAPGYESMRGRFVDDDDDEERAAGETSSLLRRGQAEAMRFWDGFVDWAFQDNILKIAVGLILASAFTDLVKSFVSDLLMPPISVILPLNRNMEEKFAVLKPGPNMNKTSGYTTLNLAQEDGAVVMAYGSFIQHLVSFLMLGLSLYAVANIYQAMSSEPIVKYTKKCKYCKTKINQRSIRCVNCTSWLDGREDQFQQN